MSSANSADAPTTVTTNKTCHICGSSQSDATKYLLTCRQCNRSYHHNSTGCYTPKILHDELLLLARKSAGKSEIEWTCRWCKKGKAKARAKAIESKATSSQPPPRVSAPEAKISAGRHADSDVIDLLSSDEGEENATSTATVKVQAKGKQPQMEAMASAGPELRLPRHLHETLGDNIPSTPIKPLTTRPRNSLGPVVLSPDTDMDTNAPAARFPSRRVHGDSEIISQDPSVNEEVVVVQPYRTKERAPAALTPGPSTLLPLDTETKPTKYRDTRVHSYQSSTPEIFPAHLGLASEAVSRAASSSEGYAEAQAGASSVPSRSISVWSTGADASEMSEDDKPEPEPGPGVYILQLPGIDKYHRLRFDDLSINREQRARASRRRQESEEDVDVDSLIFGFGKLKDIWSSTTPVSLDENHRRPRKVPAKQLNKHKKTLGQRKIRFDAAPWLKEEFGRDLNGHLLNRRTSDFM